jgi:OOP family OmpA-OmpF porin
MKINKLRARFNVIMAFAALLLLCRAAAGQSDKVKGVIKGRRGAAMTVQTQDSENATVVLMPATQVLEPEGVFGKKHLGMTALVPGLSVEVKGSYNAQNQLVADTVTFNGSDLKLAKDIQVGITPTEQQVQQSQKQIKSKAQQIRQQQQLLLAEQQVSAEHAAAIASNKPAIAAPTSASANWVITTS